MDISENGVNSSQFSPHITPKIDDHIHHALIIDGMAVVHELPGHGLKTIADLGVEFVKTVKKTNKILRYNILII